MSNDLELSIKYEPLFKWLCCDINNPLYVVDTVIITGGRNSQKSFAVGTFSCVAAKDYNHRILYTRYTLTSAQDSIIPEFNEKISILNADNIFDVTKDRIEGIRNNSKIVFKGIKTSSGNQTASLKSLKDFSMFILEEAEEMPNFDDWDKIKKSIRVKDVRNLSILLLNPTTKAHWIYEEFFEANGVDEGFNGIVGNILFIHSTYLDMERKHIADNIWDDFEDKRKAYEIYKNTSKSKIDTLDYRIKKKAVYYKHVVLGGWLDSAEGVVFDNWKIGDFTEVLTPVFGQDFGFSVDPTTLIKTSIDNKNKKIYVKECYCKPKLTTSEIANLNLTHAGKSLIYADSAEPRLINEIKEYGLNVKETIKGQGSVTAGIAVLLDYELIIDRESVNLIKELNNYVWHDKKSNTPIDAFNHCFVGNTFITTDKGLIPIKDIKEGDKVLTSQGYKRVLVKFNNGLKRVRKYTMQSDTFSVSLCSTKEHKIKSDVWKEISQLQSGMMVYQHKPSMDYISNYIQKKDIFQEEEKECTYMCGNSSTKNVRKDFIYTIRTEILGIIIQKTLSLLKEINTFLNTEEKGLKIILNGLKIFKKKVLSALRNGINQKKVCNGIKNKAGIVGLKGNTKITIANNVESNLNQDTQALLNFAITTARLKHFEQGESWNEEVYDLMIEDCHEYFANGILVHNCIDAMRYAVYSQVGNKNHFFTF